MAPNFANPPFNDVRLRQAIPYEKIMPGALFGRITPIWGGPQKIDTVGWPVPSHYSYKLDKAKALVAAATGGAEITTSLLFDAGSATIAEPMAVLVQESLAAIGIKVELNKTPGANFRGELNKKTAPMVINRFGGWLDYADYFFFWKYHGKNSIFNVASYQNKALDTLIDGARFTQDPADYATKIKAMLEMGMNQIPMVPIC